MNVLEKVDKMMLEQLETLNKTPTKDKNFRDLVEKAKAMGIIADKLINSQVTQLKKEVLQVSQKYRSFRSNLNMVEQGPVQLINQETEEFAEELDND